MWFRKKEEPDNRPATGAAKAVAESLRSDPQRWRIRSHEYLEHDTGVIVSMFGFIEVPRLDDEPDANGDLIAEAIDDWVAKSMKMPARAKEEPKPKPPASDN